MSQIDRTEGAEEKKELFEEIQKLYKEVYEHDLTADLEDKIDPNYTIANNANKRYSDDKLGRQSGIPASSAETARIQQELLGGGYR